MVIYLYLRSGKYFELIPQIRLTSSKNGVTGTAIFEINLENNHILFNSSDPIFGIGLKKKNSLRMADICSFIWSCGKPVKLIGIFIFSSLYEKQDFFDYYTHYANNNKLEFFPAQGGENSLK